jgi:hypothetical protein
MKGGAFSGTRSKTFYNGKEKVLGRDVEILGKVWRLFSFLLTLQLFSCRSLAFGWDWGRESIYRKGVLDALCLTHWNLAVPFVSQTSMQQSRPCRCIFMTLLVIVIIGFCYIVIYILMRGLRRCSFDWQGDARASMCGTSDKRIPTLFCIYRCLINISLSLGNYLEKLKYIWNTYTWRYCFCYFWARWASRQKLMTV